MFYSEQKRSCAGKHSYVTIGEAERAMQGLRKKFRANRHKKVHVYRCRDCSAFHLSSMEKGEHEERRHQHFRLYGLEPA